MFGKSITQRQAPPARRLAPVPGLPWRTFLFALVAVLGSVYAIVRHYTRPTVAPAAPTVREIPAPELEIAPAPSAR